EKRRLLAWTIRLDVVALLQGDEVDLQRLAWRQRLAVLGGADVHEEVPQVADQNPVRLPHRVADGFGAFGDDGHKGALGLTAEGTEAVPLHEVEDQLELLRALSRHLLVPVLGKPLGQAFCKPGPEGAGRPWSPAMEMAKRCE